MTNKRWEVDHINEESSIIAPDTFAATYSIEANVVFFSCRKDWPRLFVVVVVIPFLIFLFSDFFPVDKKVQQQDGWPFFFFFSSVV